MRKGVSDHQSGFDCEDVGKGTGEIRNLILTTKTYGTVDALKPLRGRLGKGSTLLFVQNGIGMPSFYSIGRPAHYFLASPCVFRFNQLLYGLV